MKLHTRITGMMNKPMLTRLKIVLLTLLIATPISAQDFPSPTGHVNDFANLLEQREVQNLESKLQTYRDTTSNVIAIAIVESLQGLPRQEVATTIFNEWRMWEGDRQNGVLILVAPNEREMQIEVGYGLEGAITDLQAGRIVDEIMRPNFQEGNFYTGLQRATTVLMQLGAGEYDAVDRATEDSGNFSFIVLIIIFIVIYTLVRASSGGGGGGKRSRHTLGSGGVVWGGGGFSGGSSGGGGFGGFSGG
ncbi:MAG: TPM domain-containing protein, partial [Balneolaceae bacterium]|nr:TPM domain-containing protein [Balneolaceae bacterium]